MADDDEPCYVEISAIGLVTASGEWMMARDKLARCRDTVDDDTGPDLEDTVAPLR